MVSGGLFLMLSGAIMALCRRVPMQAWSLTKRRFILKVEILNNDQVFQWMKIWLDAQPYSKRARDLSVSSSEQNGSMTQAIPVLASQPEEKSRPKIIFTPAPGIHFFIYKKRLIWLERTRSEASDKDGWSGYRESFQIRLFGRSQEVIRSLISEAMEMALPPDDPRIVVFASCNDYWRQVGMKQPRDTQSVILPCGVFEGLVKDVESFVSSESYYNDLGIPYRRGYLLHGVPGSGKTSSIIALAGALRMNIYILNLADKWTSDELLNRLLSDVPERAIVLLEDVDAVFNGREQRGESKSGITFSGLLNALDGAATKDGRILFMTTNHIERLDEALIRPGRADVRLGFDYATHDQARAFFARFYPDADLDLACCFASLIGSRTSMADIQQHLLEHRACPDAAIRSWTPREAKALSYAAD